MKELVPLLVAIPLGTAFLVVVLAHLKSTKGLTGPVAWLAVAANLALGVTLWAGAYSQGQPWRIWLGGWENLGVELVFDGMAGLMVITLNLVALPVMIFAIAYMRKFHSRWLFRGLFLLMLAAMNAAVLAGDLFSMYVAIETAALASYALVAFGCEGEELEAAFKYLVLGVLASTFIVVGITVLYALTGHLNMAMVGSILAARPELAHSPAVLLVAAALLGGLALKAAMVPFHAWLPDAHPSAPAPVSALMSAVLIKAVGVYGLARIVFNVLGVSPYYAGVLMALGVASMVIGMLMANGQWDIKRLMAYSTISQAGYIVLALGVAADVMSRPTPDRAVAALCLVGGLFHLLNHATFKSLLFLTSGAIEQATGTRQLQEMGGLAQRMPVTALCCRVGALSIAGVPPFNGFLSKLLIVIALVLAGHWLLATVAVAVAVGTLVMYVKVQRYALDGEVSARTAEAHEAPWPMGLGMLVLAGLCLVGGVAFFWPLNQYLLTPAGEALLRGAGPAIGLLAGGAP